MMPEARARLTIDKHLADAGWLVQRVALYSEERPVRAHPPRLR